MSRRSLLIAGGAACAAAAGALPAWHLIADRGAAIRRMIESHMRGAPVAEDAIDAFVDDFLERQVVLRDGVAIDNACRLLGIEDLAQPCANNAVYMRRIEERVVDLFIRSTDMFSPDRRPDDPIGYVEFWDPYSGACRNPFADLSPPESATG